MTKQQIKYVEGDLFASLDDEKNFQVFIPHVVNDEKVWGAGFVIPLAQRFPNARECYFLNDKLALGHTQFVNSDDDGRVVVANMVAQHFGNMPPLDEESLQACMKTVAKECKERAKLDQYEGVEIRCPLFGAGIAGGDWNVIHGYIKKYWKGLSVTVYYLSRFLPPGWKPPCPEKS